MGGAECRFSPHHLPIYLPASLQLCGYQEKKYMSSLWQTECTAYMRRYERANKPVAAFMADKQRYQELREEVCGGGGGLGIEGVLPTSSGEAAHTADELLLLSHPLSPSPAFHLPRKGAVGGERGQCALAAS